MSKRFIITIVILVITALSVYGYLSLTKEERMYQIVLESHVRLVVTKDNQTSFASSVIFDEDDTYYYGLTNHHVVSGSSAIDAVDYKNEIYDVTVIDSSAYYDLAIIKFEKNSLNPLHVLKLAESYNINDEIKAVGYPRSIFTISTGLIDTIDVIVHDVTLQVIHHTAVIDHGSSGGALLNLKNEIVGINFGADPEVNMSYAIPGLKVKQYVDSISYKG
jgi:serine protease Do